MHDKTAFLTRLGWQFETDHAKDAFWREVTPDAVEWLRKVADKDVKGADGRALGGFLLFVLLTPAAYFLLPFEGIRLMLAMLLVAAATLFFMGGGSNALFTAMARKRLLEPVANFPGRGTTLAQMEGIAACRSHLEHVRSLGRDLLEGDFQCMLKLGGQELLAANSASLQPAAA